jgi:hypothetical protein
VNRQALEHLLRAAAALTGESTFYVVGSAAILVSLPDDAVPDIVQRSREADLIPASESMRSIDLIDGALGLDSMFDSTFGYYADGVEPATVGAAPEGWRSRAIRFEGEATGGAIGLCMEPHDLVIAKLCAGREKDLEFVRDVIALAVVRCDLLFERLRLSPAFEREGGLAEQRLRAYCEGRGRRDSGSQA